MTSGHNGRDLISILYYRVPPVIYYDIGYVYLLMYSREDYILFFFVKF
jgi:hypothetical protein